MLFLFPAVQPVTNAEFTGDSIPASMWTQLIILTVSSAADLDSRWLAILCRCKEMCCSLAGNTGRLWIEA